MPDPIRPDQPFIFSCSGSADVGGIGDSAARKISADGIARMYCLAGIGARVEQIVSNTELAESLISIDGCENDCSHKLLQAAGFQPALHIRITDLGMSKGNTPITPERVQNVVDDVLRKLREYRNGDEEDPA